jgi:6-pyruvoyltetrahydropterin/6-carboxytetrahydropterin synthase
MGYKYLSTKVFSGYSTCFRQWRANHSHCQYLHGYSLKFKVWFEAKELDDKNWVQDFGSFKNNGINNILKDIFDHTTVVAQDDPCLQDFKNMAEKGLIQLRVIENVGCERFAELVFHKINEVVLKESNNRVSVSKVECFEHERNSAIYEKD